MTRRRAILLHRGRRLLSMGALFAGGVACDPVIVIGERFGFDAGEDAPFHEASASDATDGDGQPQDVADSTAMDANQPMLLWFADHEVGNLGQWSVGGDVVGGYYRFGNSALELTSMLSQSGSYAVRCFIDTTSGTSHGARLYRRTENGGAYYSAWFRLADVHSVTNWWSIFLFHARDRPEPSDSTHHLWDLRLVQPAEGELAVSLFEHETARSLSAAPHSVPIRQWFHLEAYFEYRPPAGSQLTVWLDGEQLLDAIGLRGDDQRPVYWVIGNGSNELAPDLSTLFVDDAAIATARLGP